MSKPVRAAIGDMWITCMFCKGSFFRDREVKLNSELYKTKKGEV